MTAIIETTPAGVTLLKCHNPVTKEPLRVLECHSLDEVDRLLEKLRNCDACGLLLAFYSAS